jgi:CheY-like chemotaxis protein
MTHKILLADDSVTIRKVVELTFSDEDFTIVSVGDGAQALERARAEQPDIVISDVMMPGLDGYDLASRSEPTRRFVQPRFCSSRAPSRASTSRRQSAARIWFIVAVRVPGNDRRVKE